MLQKIVLILFCTLNITIGLGAQENPDSINKNSRAIFLKGVSILTQAGGIASFDVPDELDPFPKGNIEGMSSEEIERLVRKAVAYLKKSLELNPSLHEAHYYLGVAYTRILMVDEAIKSFQKSVQYEPERILTYNLLCGLLLERGRYSEVIQIAHKFIHKFPTNRALGNIWIGMAYYESGDYEQAIKLGKEVLLLDSKNIDGHILLASSYYMLKRYEDSESEFQKVIEINPEMKSKVAAIKKGLKAD